MKSYKSLGAYTFTAGADVTKHRFIGADGQHCGAGKKAAGVSHVNADSGDEFAVEIGGIVIIEAGAAFSAGDELSSDANGKGIEAVAVTVSVPADTTPVLSDAAQPTLVVAGGALPIAINAVALDDASGDTVLARARLV